MKDSPLNEPKSEPEFVEPIDDPHFNAPPIPPAKQTSSPVPTLPGPTRRARQYRLNQLMVLSVGFALIFSFIGRAIFTGANEDVLMAAASVSVGLLALGIYLLQRMTRHSWSAWCLVFLGLAGATGLSLGFFGIIFLIIMLLSIAHILARYRATQQDALLWAIALASDRSMPLGPSLRAFSEQLGFAFRRKARALADCLDNGMPLPDALEFIDKAAPAPAIVLARVGWDCGGLPEALRMATSERLKRGPNSNDFGTRIAYLSMLLLSVQIIIGFIMYFIMPKFEAIFKDFGMSLPAVTILVIQGSHFFTRFGLIPVLPLIEIAFMIYLPFAINGWGGLGIPLFDRMFIRRHRILILKALALVVGREQPIALGVLSLTRAYPTPWVRRRLTGAWKSIESGHGWADSLRAYGLLSQADAEVLISAERVGNLLWALKELAENGERRYGQRLALLAQVIFSLVLLMTGGLIGLLAVAYFMPLVDLISKLAG